MNRKQCWNCLFLLVIAITGECAGMSLTSPFPSKIIQLPEADKSGGLPLNSTLSNRRSYRDFLPDALTLADLSQLLWSTQGITHPRGFRTTPSAGALYPLEIYLLAANIEGLEPGIYYYDPRRHTLRLTLKGDKRSQLASAAYRQDCIKNAPAVIAINAVFARTHKKYHQRGTRYVHIEAGNAAQNIYLQATSLKLGTVYVGAFYDSAVQKVLTLPKNVEPLGLMPVGHIP